MWIDGDCWSVVCDYRKEALERFEKKTGISLNGSAPVSKEDKYFDEYLEFTREEYREYLRKYVNKLHEKCPGLEICVNWAFSDHMPECVSADIDFLSGDLDPDKCICSARYAGRMLAMQNKPWDLMSWGFRFNVYKSPLIPPKNPVQLMQEAAAVISLGGSYQNNILQFADGSHDVDRILMNVPLANFVRERREFCHGGKIIEQAVMLVPSYDRYKEMTRPFTREGRMKFLGLCDLLCDSGESLSIVNEVIFKENMSKYPLVVIPELYTEISGELIELLRAYVTNGGSLIITGTKNTRQLASPTFPYETKEYEKYPYTPGWMFNSRGFIKREFSNGTPAYVCVNGSADFGCTVGAVGVKAENSTVIARLYPSLRTDECGTPLAAVIPYAKGKIGVIGTDIGTQYDEFVQYQFRDIIRSMTTMLYNPIAKVESADGIAEIVCLSVGGKLMLQIVNAGGSHRDLRHTTENYLPPLENVVISIRSDINLDSVVIQPEGKTLKTYIKGERTCFEIPRVAIHSIAEIRLR